MLPNEGAKNGVSVGACGGAVGYVGAHVCSGWRA